MSSSTSNSAKSLKYPSENSILFILHVAMNIFCRKKKLNLDQALTGLFIVIPSGDGWITIQS